MTLGQRFAVFSAIALLLNSALSVTIAPMRSPQAFHTLEAVSIEIRRPEIPFTSFSVIPQIEVTLSSV